MNAPSQLSASDAMYVRDLLQKRAAIQLDETKQYLLELRLGELAREAGTTISGVIERAKRGDQQADRGIIEALTTHETSFFRDLLPFRALTKAIIPALRESRAGARTLSIWSAACSSGQEPVSIAISLLEHCPELASWNVRIVATDLSEKILDKARECKFTQLEMNRGMPAPLLLKYFEREGVAYRAKPQVRAMIEFRKLNLLESWGALSPDIVFMRNVLIYFDIETKRSIYGRLRTTLARDGALFLGSAESMLGIDDRWDREEAEKTSFYRVRK